ncbi:hypothetical protein [Plantactinospora sp. KBS50]|uniref:hypothetical protein n=1 Tax=Plantactinospora sp. KBS50 TaxID=2024580 RepID=UPI0018DFDA4A|nr:hypothetical protein [Plantactinospora sp. KBS50]
MARRRVADLEKHIEVIVVDQIDPLREVTGNSVAVDILRCPACGELNVIND